MLKEGGGVLKIIVYLFSNSAITVGLSYSLNRCSVTVKKQVVNIDL